VSQHVSAALVDVPTPPRKPVVSHEVPKLGVEFAVAHLPGTVKLSSTNLGAVVSPELKERLKQYADLKRWSMGQTAAVLIEDGLERYEEEKKGKAVHRLSFTRG
jgi:hypothetical protein